MPYPIDKKLVVGISSNALFDLREEDKIFREEGLEAYRNYQNQRKTHFLKEGVGFPFIKRFLDINKIYSQEEPVEVVLLSRNSPETGIRVFNSIKHYNLNITRAAFMSGSSAIEYIPAFNISLFLSTNANDVKNAINLKLPAGRILQTLENLKEDNSSELRVAFDFDGVIANDEAEQIYKEKGILSYHQYEAEHSSEELGGGPLADFFKKLAFFKNLKLRNDKKILIIKRF